MLKQKGFTLIEAMVGLAAGFILLASLVSLYVSTISSTNTVVSMGKLEYELSTAISLMEDEIRRAGYYSNAVNDLNTGANTNPFIVGSADINTPSSSCILFTYDSNKSGTLPALGTAGTDNRFGFQLVNNIIQVRPPTLSSFTCGTGTWNNLTDPNILKVTGLTFTINASAPQALNPGTLTIRTVNITLTGQLVSNAAVTRTLTETVRIRNDKFTIP